MGKYVTPWDKWHYRLSHMYAESQVHMLATNNICKKKKKRMNVLCVLLRKESPLNHKA